MRKSIVFLAAFIVFCSVVSGQKSIFFEAGGTGGLGSINYTRIFSKKANIDISYRVGLSFAPIDKNNGVAIVLPIMLNGKIGKTKHKLDFGIGQSVSITTKGSAFILGTAMIGYRLEPENSNYYYTFRYTPIVSYLIDFQWQHWGGIGVGYKF